MAMDGEGALELAHTDPPDLILLDIMMPGMDGYEVCRRLKADEKTKDIPVIFVTAMGEIEDETKGFELGAVDYITKPSSIDEIRRTMRKILESWYSSRQSILPKQLPTTNASLDCGINVLR